MRSSRLLLLLGTSLVAVSCAMLEEPPDGCRPEYSSVYAPDPNGGGARMIQLFDGYACEDEVDEQADASRDEAEVLK